MRRATHVVLAALLAGAALAAGCRGLPERAAPARPGPGPATDWQQDDAFLQARAVAAAGAPSPTPELDAIAALASSLTPELGLAALLVPADRPTPAARLRAGDLLALDVYGRPELSGERRVGPDGRLPLLQVGPLAVADLTEVEAAEAVAAALRALARRPQVQVRLLESSPATARVVGRVAEPGLHPLPPERALDCLDLLALCGGLLDDADVARLALLRREGGRTRAYHFTHDELLAARPAGLAAPLRPDDVLVVPRLPAVYAFGQVGRTGAFPLRPGATVASLLLHAGGLTPAASAADLQLLRGGGEAAPAPLDRALAPGDVVFVPERRRVYLVGEGVGTSGPIDLPSAGLTVVQAIAAAGWLTRLADLDGVEVLRYRGGEGTRLAIPLRQILSGEAQASDYPLQPGDVVYVPETVW